MDDLMMSPAQIATGCLLTAVGVAVAAVVVRWPRGQVLVAAVASVAVVAAWRGLCNILGTTGEFTPPVTVADLSCLVAGAIGPVLATLLPGTPARRQDSELRTPAVECGAGTDQERVDAHLEQAGKRGGNVVVGIGRNNLDLPPDR